MLLMCNAAKIPLITVLIWRETERGKIVFVWIIILRLRLTTLKEKDSVCSHLSGWATTTGWLLGPKWETAVSIFPKHTALRYNI